MQHLREPGIVGRRQERRKGGANDAKDGNARSTEEEGRPHVGGRSRPFVGGDREPQDEQRRRNRRRSDNRREGFEEEHQLCQFQHTYAANAGGFIVAKSRSRNQRRTSRFRFPVTSNQQPSGVTMANKPFSRVLYVK